MSKTHETHHTMKPEAEPAAAHTAAPASLSDRTLAVLERLATALEKHNELVEGLVISDPNMPDEFHGDDGAAPKFLRVMMAQR